MQPYRRRFIGLPLQRSMFAEIDRAPALIGVRGVLAGDRLAARLDAEGDLYLDTADVERLAAALPALATPAFLAEMKRALAAACDAVEAATENARRGAATAGEPEARALLAALGGGLIALVPFGILSKFVPDALYRALKAAGDDGDPPFPRRSPGAALTAAAAALCLACRARGYEPDRLRSEWPHVPADVASLVGDFCRAHTGFGPLAWEVPGYEDPQYVFGILAVMFAGDDPEALLRRLTTGPRAAPRPADPPGTPALRLVLAAWMEFLERETWYVRRAFYLGLVPLLQRLLPACRRECPGVVAEDLLFLELRELLVHPPEVSAAPPRRAKYLAETGYLADHGIAPARLHAVMEAA